MLHSIKRHTIGRLESKNEPKNSEFELYQSRLDNIQNALSNTLDDIQKAETCWTNVIANMQKISSDLYTLYPQDDEIRTLFKSTVDQVTQPISNDISKITSPTSQVKSIERMIRAYLTEIKTLSQEYQKVEKARKDYAMYQAKTDKLDKTNTDDDKRSRNLDKKEASKATYDSILEGILHRMKSTYEKSNVMFKAAYVAHWTYQKEITTLFTTKANDPFEYSQQNAQDLFSFTSQQTDQN